MCNLSWTPHSNLGKDNYSSGPSTDCLKYTRSKGTQVCLYSENTYLPKSILVET